MSPIAICTGTIQNRIQESEQGDWLELSFYPVKARFHHFPEMAPCEYGKSETSSLSQRKGRATSPLRAESPGNLGCTGFHDAKTVFLAQTVDGSGGQMPPWSLADKASPFRLNHDRP